MNIKTLLVHPAWLFYWKSQKRRGSFLFLGRMRAKINLRLFGRTFLGFDEYGVKINLRKEWLLSYNLLVIKELKIDLVINLF
ncbi:hypothetical protein AYO37_01240 [Opitutia bacterium SCGC AG-212-L18]|nr:hypothetical protein AYO37_01240 [Opitutae bacterium SCGC AG-212-L18]